MPTSGELLSNIQAGISTNNVDPTTEDQEASALDQDADKAIKLEQLKLKREQLKQLEQNREERKKYARHIFTFTCYWAVSIFVILILSGWKNSWTHFDISDKVLITLITSTTVNFFGFFLLVVKYLFNTGDSIKESDKISPTKTSKKRLKAKKEEDKEE